MQNDIGKSQRAHSFDSEQIWIPRPCSNQIDFSRLM
jgi:hypothetical protein